MIDREGILPPDAAPLPGDDQCIPTDPPKATISIDLQKGTFVMPGILFGSSPSEPSEPLPPISYHVEVGEMISTIDDDAHQAIHAALTKHGINDPITRGWIDRAISDINQAIPKSREYGSAELQYLGDMMNAIHRANPGEDMAYESAILFYVLGKVGRWVSAYRRGEKVSEDTLLDITTYSMMVRLIRARDGEWV